MVNTTLLKQVLGNKIKLSSQYFNFIMMLNSCKLNQVKAIAYKFDELELHVFPWYAKVFRYFALFSVR